MQLSAQKTLGMDRLLLEQAIKYFRSPVHESTSLTNLQYLQDLWANDEPEDEQRMTMKYVQRLLIASENALAQAERVDGLIQALEGISRMSTEPDKMCNTFALVAARKVASDAIESYRRGAP